VSRTNCQKVFLNSSRQHGVPETPFDHSHPAPLQLTIWADAGEPTEPRALQARSHCPHSSSAALTAYIQYL